MRYQIRHALVLYAADTILEDVNFEIHDKEKIAVVGQANQPFGFVNDG